MADDLSLSSKHRLIALLNADNNTATTEQMISFGSPAPTTLHNRNTVIRVTAVPGFGLRGFYNYYYNRLNFADGLDIHAPDKTIHANGVTNTHELIPYINAQWGINLNTDDIRLTNIPVNATQVTIQASVNSLAWIGGVTFDLLPVPVVLSELLSPSDMFGFITAGVPSFALANLTFSDNSQILSLINANYDIALTSLDVSISAPTPITPDGDGRNTEITLTALRAPYVGSVTIRYTRADIGELLALPIDFNDVLNESIGTTHQILADAMSVAPILLGTDEVVSENINPTNTVFTLTISDNSYVWLPGSTFTVQYDPIIVIDDSEYELSDSGEYALSDSGDPGLSD